MRTLFFFSLLFLFGCGDPSTQEQRQLSPEEVSLGFFKAIYVDRNVEQAKQFAQATDINALAVTKLDGTAKGGVVIGISDQMKIPVKYIGVGEKMQDLQLFDRKAFVESLFK